ncbi:hypothetical protein H920_07704 [Fukomys damarensis]|uniref:Uncharacterized protein n=1 Tax=Fukomys damarensis TaxID=885580 RepID=A0A091DK81_FUKDA|nr:hypothetical protein H920_07704 [Fukomys damarensis]
MNMKGKHFEWFQGIKAATRGQLKTDMKKDFQSCFRKWQGQRGVVQVDDDDDDFDIGHVSQSSCDGEMEQELTDTDTGNAELLDSDGEENSKVNIYI